MSNTILATRKLTFRQIKNSRVFLGFLSLLALLGLASIAVLLAGNAKPETGTEQAKRMPVNVVPAEFVEFFSHLRYLSPT